MILDITEEEREFLERICTRTYAFATRDIPKENPVKTHDYIKLMTLMEKLKK